jgi:hypothetical protein
VLHGETVISCPITACAPPINYHLQRRFCPLTLCLVSTTDRSSEKATYFDLIIFHITLMLTPLTKLYCKSGGIKAVYISITWWTFSHKRISSGIYTQFDTLPLSAQNPQLNLLVKWLSQYRSTTARKEKRIKWPARLSEATPALRRAPLDARRTTPRSKRSPASTSPAFRLKARGSE